MIYIFYTTSIQRLNNITLNDLLGRLRVDIKDNILKFKKWEDQQRSLLGKILLMEGLKRIGIASHLNYLKYTKFNKPYLDENVDFNISHSGKYVLCVISKTSRVGIDVEEIKEVPFNDFENNFSDSEWEEILTSKNSLRIFYKLWTQKEAFLKAVGMGLNVPLKEVILVNNKTLWEDKEWFLQEIILDSKYACHLCTDAASPAMIVEHLKFN